MGKVTVSNLTVSIQDGRRNRTIIRDLSFESVSGTITGLAGPSGSGKTTVLSCIAGIQTFDSGSVTIGDTVYNGCSLSGPDSLRKIGFVFQEYHLLHNVSVLDNVALPLHIDGQSWSNARKNARSILDYLGLKGLGNQLPPTLSGGEKQRVALARALIRKPQVVLADEPSAHLDNAATKELADLLAVTASYASLIVASHDSRLLECCSRIVMLD